VQSTQSQYKIELRRERERILISLAPFGFGYFDFLEASRDTLEKKFLEDVCAILGTENVRYDERKVAAIVKAHYPDLRQILIELESRSRDGLPPSASPDKHQVRND
jgi:hypothetical protein